MAEALGLTASIIAVVDMTGKAGSASFKLMRLWNEVKEVPVMLLEKAERIKDLEEFLDDAESQIAKNQLPRAVYDMARLQKHIAKARRALTDVQEMVDHLQAKVNADQRGFKRKFASTKVLLRKDEWNALEKSLDSALYLLSITQTQYLVAMSTFCTTFIQEQPRSTKIPGQSLIANSDSFEVDEKKQNIIKRRKPSYAHSTVANAVYMPHSNSFLPAFRFGFGANSSFQFSVLTPTWLSGTLYSILAQRSIQGWQLNLRAYEVIEDFPHELVHCLRKDDYLGFFRYLDENKITLHIRNGEGDNLLQLAVVCHGLTTTKLLLERGLGGYVSEPISPTVDTPFLLYLFPGRPILGYVPRDLQFLELFADYGLDDVLGHAETSGILLWQGVSCPAFRAFLNRNDFGYTLLPMRIRLWHLRKLAESGSCWSPDEIKQIIPETEELTDEIIKLSVEEEHSLIHSFTLLFSRRLIIWGNRPDGEQRLEEKRQWSKLIDSCIRQDSTSLHRLESALARHHEYGYTKCSPFSSIVWSFLDSKVYPSLTVHSWQYPRRYARRLETSLESVFTAWIATLSDCGVDLLSYGRQERRLYDEGSTRYRRRRLLLLWALPETPRFFFIGFTYGSRPQQWRLWWTLEYEEYVGEFWNLVESQDFKMPGSWVDEPWDHEKFKREEMRRSRIWLEEEETTPLIWSEYRKIRPPI